MPDNYIRQQKVVGVKMYPDEIQALEVIAKLSGWNGKSTALREFMKIWVECAVIAIENKSVTKGSLQMLKSMLRINKQMDTIIKNTAKDETENLFHADDLEILKGALAR